MIAKMTFTHISLDPGGTYIGRTANGWFWYYLAPLGKWLVLDTGEKQTNPNN